MTNDIFAKALAPSLGYEANQVGQYVDKVLELALEELLLNGTVTIAGIGTLKRIYHPSEAREYEPGKLFLVPPRQSVELVQTDSTDDFVFETALGQFNMDEDRASRFSKGIALTVQKVLDVAAEMEFGNIGTLKKRIDGYINLTPSAWLTEMLNKSYSHLEPTPISSSKPREESVDQPGSRKPEEPRPADTTPSDANLFEPLEPAIKQPEEPSLFFSEPPAGKEESKEQSIFEPFEATSGTKKSEDNFSSNFVPTYTPPPSTESVGSYSGSVSSGNTRSESKDAKKDDDHAWLYEEPKKDYSPLYITLGAIALVAVLIGMSLVLFSGNDNDGGLPKKDTSKIEKQEEAAKQLASEKLDKQESAPSAAETEKQEDAAKTTTESPDKQQPVVKQEPPTTKTEMPVVPPPSKVEKQVAPPSAKTEKPVAPPVTKQEQPKVEKTKPEPAKAVAQKAEPQKPAKETGASSEFSKKVDLKKGGYSISVGSFPDKAVAQKVAEDYKKKGLTVTLWEVEVKGTTYNRLLVGSYSSQDEARAAIKKHVSLLPQGAFPVTVK
ncbi:MAG: hypothetical protein HGB11_11390 [Chlorobiales bacterium]|nr:hypothetical protein [Chlorobiales bacterium]